MLPAAHYTMGGIDVDMECRTGVEGFFACGECACVNVHGANRLGGNSLLECVVFGAQAGQIASEEAGKKKKSQQENIARRALKKKFAELAELFGRSGSENQYEIAKELNSLMDNKVQVFREKSQLESALKEIEGLKDRFQDIKNVSQGRVFNYDKTSTLEIKANLDLAEAITRCALQREESRGAHYREDFPRRDDRKWLKHSIVQYNKKGLKLSYKKVAITKWQPVKRRY